MLFVLLHCLGRFVDFVIGVILLMLSTSAFGSEYQITPETELKSLLKKVVAGDFPVLQNGEWKDADLKFELLKGTADTLISIRAETPGKVVLTG